MTEPRVLHETSGVPRTCGDKPFSCGSNGSPTPTIGQQANARCPEGHAPKWADMRTSTRPNGPMCVRRSIYPQPAISRPAPVHRAADGIWAAAGRVSVAGDAMNRPGDAMNRPDRDNWRLRRLLRHEAFPVVQGAMESDDRNEGRALSASLGCWERRVADETAGVALSCRQLAWLRYRNIHASKDLIARARSTTGQRSNVWSST
jgi:hypothetical protein